MKFRNVVWFSVSVEAFFLLPLLAGVSSSISPSGVYDLSPSYLATGISKVLPIGYTNITQISTNNSGDGGTSIKLGGIGLMDDGQMSGIEWGVIGPGFLSFDWKVSSELDWDWLRFYEVDVSQTNSISGITSWARQSVTVLGAPDQSHTFRWEYQKDPVSDYVGEDCAWVDAITWIPLYTIIVANGTGDGLYTNKTSVSIAADTPSHHFEFDRWIGDTNGVENVFASNTMLVIPTTNVTLTATYKPILYTLTVTGGNGSGSYPYQSSVEIRAETIEGKQFYCWTGDTISIADLNAATTTVITSDGILNVSATYKLLLSVSQGTGTGWYLEGSTANVVADLDPMYKEFSGWTGNAALYASNQYARSTTITIPLFPSSLTANYSDSVARTTGCWGRDFTTAGTSGGISVDLIAGEPSGTAAVKLGGTGVIPDNGIASFETIVSGSGTISFWWKVSSEASADYLKFKIDGVETNSISGTKIPWTQVTRRVEGTGDHVLRWEYVKDGSVASSLDAGWVDDIVWTGDTQTPVLTPLIVHASLTNQSMKIQFTGERGMTYLVQTNGTLDHAAWSDYQTLQPTWINESNGVHRFEIAPPASGPDTLFYRISTP